MSPSWPSPLNPKHVTLPPLAGERSAHEKSAPTAAATTSVSGAGVGTARPIWVPWPTWPWSLRPQHHSALLPSMAQLVSPPAAIAITPCRLSIDDGIDCGFEPPLPSWPSSLAPRPARLWSPRIAQLCPLPVAIATAPVSPDTATGAWKSLIEPLPSWPALLWPQHHTEAALPSAQLCSSPPAIAENFGSPVPITWTGVVRSVVLPSPTWPKLLRPQHHAVPSLRIAQLWPSPAATAAAHAAGCGWGGTQRMSRQT